MRNETEPGDVAPHVTSTTTPLTPSASAASSTRPRADAGGARWAIVDLVRGLAIVAVVVYHLVWDLGYFGVIDQWAHTPTGRWVGHVIAGTFLFLTGFALVLAHRHSVDPKAFVRRLGKLVACAYAITAVSLIFAPKLLVSYGILHDLALTSVLLLPFLRASRLVGLGAGLLAAAAPMIVSIDSTSRWVTWTGLTPTLSPSLDVQPLLPGFAVSLAGLLVARILLSDNRLGSAVAAWRPTGAAAAPADLLGTWGRHTLGIYLLHQPVLFGILELARLVGWID